MWIEKVSKRFIVACVIFIMGIILIGKGILENIDEHKEFYDYNSLNYAEISKEAILIAALITVLSGAVIVVSILTRKKRYKL